jgi:hypothetical protein
MLMLGILKFKLESLRPTGESTRISRISLVSRLNLLLLWRFTVIVNNMRANVAVLPYDEHDRAIKLLHSLDRTVWSEKVKAILESEKYGTLTVDELFSKLKSSEVDRGVRAKIENPTDPHSLALVSGSRTNANMSSRHFLCLALCPCQMRSSTCWARRTSRCGAGGSCACT